MSTTAPAGASSRRDVLVRTVSLFALIAALAVSVFWLSRVTRDSDPLNPNDSMAAWREANAEQKRATAEILLDQWRDDGTLGPANQAALDRSGGRQTFGDTLIAALDAATDRNRPDYVAPGEPIERTARGIAFKLGWNQ